MQHHRWVLRKMPNYEFFDLRKEKISLSELLSHLTGDHRLFIYTQTKKTVNTENISGMFIVF